MRVRGRSDSAQTPRVSAEREVSYAAGIRIRHVRWLVPVRRQSSEGSARHHGEGIFTPQAKLGSPMANAQCASCLHCAANLRRRAMVMLAPTAVDASTRRWRCVTGLRDPGRCISLTHRRTHAPHDIRAHRTRPKRLAQFLLRCASRAPTNHV